MLRVLAEAGDPGRALDELVVPEGVSEVVVRRVARLGEPAEEILTLAAVAGQAFRAALLERAADAPRAPSSTCSIAPSPPGCSPRPTTPTA